MGFRFHERNLFFLASLFNIAFTMDGCSNDSDSKFLLLGGDRCGYQFMWIVGWLACALIIFFFVVLFVQMVEICTCDTSMFLFIPFYGEAVFIRVSAWWLHDTICEWLFWFMTFVASAVIVIDWLFYVEVEGACWIFKFWMKWYWYSKWTRTALWIFSIVSEFTDKNLFATCPSLIHLYSYILGDLNACPFQKNQSIK